MNFIRDSKMSMISLILIVCMFMIIILLIVDIATVNKNEERKTLIEEISKVYNQDEEDVNGSVSKTSSNGYLSESEVLNKMYPIGSIYISTNSQNPGEYIGGEWESFGEGKTLVGIDSSDSDFSTVEKTGGNKEIKLDNKNMPQRVTISVKLTNNYSLLSGMKWTSTKANKDDFFLSTLRDFTAIGEDYEYEVPISVMQPYIVTYMWKRVS